MNPHQTSVPTDPVEAALTHLHHATTTIVAPEIEVIMGRARRRRMTQTVLAGVAALLAVGLAVAVVNGPSGGQSMPSTAPTAESTPTPTEPTGDTRVDPARGIPSGFLESPRLGEVGENVVAGHDPSEPPEWRDQGVLGPQCPGIALVDQLTVIRGVGADGAPVKVSLYLYPDEASARTAFAAIELDLRECIGYVHAQPQVEQWRSFGDQSAAVSFAQPADGSGDLTGMANRAIALRVGRAIEVLAAHPTIGFTGRVEAASAAALELVVEEHLPRLCLWSSAGCSPAPGKPPALAELTQAGDAWLVLVRALHAQEVDLNLGRAVALAAESGYHPTVVRWACDIGVDVSYVGGDVSARYVALYFGQQDQAQVVVSALPTYYAAYLHPTVHAVRTRCVD